MTLEEIFKQLITGNWVTLTTWITNYIILRNVEIFKKKKSKEKIVKENIESSAIFYFQNKLIFW